VQRGTENEMKDWREIAYILDDCVCECVCRKDSTSQLHNVNQAIGLHEHSLEF